MKEHILADIEYHEYDGYRVLEKIQCVLTSDIRLGIVGANGAGKTTFFRLLSGQETPSKGVCVRHGGISLSFLSQLPIDDISRTVFDELLSVSPEIVELEKLIQYHEARLDDPHSVEMYIRATEEYAQYSGKEFRGKIDKVLRGLNIFHYRDQALHQVSGGERTKVALAKILLSRSHLLFLDEPTNHLDLDATLWLENFLTNEWRGGYVIISHDRRFLDITCQKTAELAQGELTFYDGNYSFFMKEKRRIQERQEQMYEIQQTHIASEKALINRFRAGSRASFAKSREKALERIEIRTPPKKIIPPTFTFTFTPTGSNRSLFIEQAFIGRRDPLFVIHELQLEKGRHVGIIGGNGVGKSTFMKTLTGELPLLDGKMLLGESDHIGYYSQTLEQLLCDKQIRHICAQLTHERTDEALMGLLSPYGFFYDDLAKSCLELSGGERSKLAFALLGSTPASLLFLDEPTNHLDMYAKESLEQSLKKFPGTLIFISHDRYFIDAVADELWVIEDGELKKSFGNYSDLLQKKEQGIAYDQELVDIEGEMSLVLEEKLGAKEAQRIQQKFGRMQSGKKNRRK